MLRKLGGFSGFSIKALVGLLVVVIHAIQPLHAQTLLGTYEFTGQSLAVTDGDVGDGITFSDLTIGTGYGNLFDNGAGDFLRLSADDTENGSGAAFTNDAILSFTVTNNSGSDLVLGSFQADYKRTNGSGYNSSRLLSDVQGSDDIVGDTIGVIGAGAGDDASFVTDVIDLTSTGLEFGTNVSSSDFTIADTSSITFFLPWIDGSALNTVFTDLDNISLYSPTPATEWTFDGGGTWNTPANWASNPNVPGVGALLNDNASIGPSITTGDSTIELDVAVQLNRLTLSNNDDVVLGPGAGSLTLTGDSVISTNGSGNHEVSGVIAGTAGLTKQGTGDLYLSGSNTFTGPINIESGRLRPRSIDSIDNTAGGTITITGGSSLILQGDGNESTSTGNGFSGTIVPDIAGDGSLILSGSLTTETVTLDSAKTINGTVQVNGGILVIADGGALGTGGTGGTNEGTRTAVLGGSDDGQLQLTGGITVASETLDINERDADNTTAALSNLSGNNTWNGVIELDGGAGNYNIESQADLLTLGGNIIDSDDTVDGIATLRLSGAGNGRINGLFVDNDGDGGNAENDNNNIALVKTGSGTWTIATALAGGFDAATSLYQGDTTIVEGTLEVLTDSPLNNQGELRGTNVIVQSGATLDVDDFSRYNLQVGQNLGGAGTVTAQVLGYFDDGSLTPGDSVGTLTINGDLDMDSFSSSPSGALNFELGSTTTLGGSVNDLISVNGNVTIDPASAGNMFTINVTPVGAGMATGTYTLIDVVGGSLTGSAVGSDFTVNLVDNEGNPVGDTRQSFSANVNQGADELQLVVSGSAGTQTWTGNVNAFWNINLTANWSGTGNQYFDLDNVVFSDTASTFNVEVSEDVNPASMVFSNSSGNPYTISGLNGIKGGATLTISNGGSVTFVNGGNTFTGDISVGTGTLTFGDGVTDELNVIGESNNISISAGGRVVLNDVDGESLNGDISGGGTVENLNGGTSGLGGNITDIAIIQNGTGVLNASGIISGSSSVTKNVGSGNLTLSGNNTYTGLTTVNDGTMLIDNTDTGSPLGATGAVGSGRETIVDSGTLRANGETGTISESLLLRNGGQFAVGGGDASALTIDADITIGTGGGRIQVDGDTGADGLTIDASIVGTVGGDLQVSPGNNSTVSVTGNVSNNGTLSKTGAGTLALTGPTSAITTSTIDLSGGDIDVTATTSGELALTGQTLRIGGVGSELTQQIDVSEVADADNRISYDPTDPDSDATNNHDFQIRVGINSGGNNVARGVAQWDISSVIPAGNTLVSVDSVSFSFEDNSANAISNGAEDLQLFELTKDFVSTEVTAAQASDGNPWTGYTSDGDADPNAAGSSDLGLALGSINAEPGLPETDPTITFANSTNTRLAAQNALNGDGVLSVLLKIQDETTGTNGFFAFDDNSDPNGPNLDMTITVSGPVGIGSATVTGDLAIDAASTLEIDIFNTTVFDSLAITGNLDAGGTLDVGLVGSYAFADGDSFDILDFATSSGAFDNINLPALAAGLEWDTSSLLVDGTIAVEVESTAIVGDYDGNGSVAQGDLDVVLLNWGTGNFVTQPGSLPADEAALPYPAPFDGLIDQDELDGVLLNWGNTSLAASATVPEPATGLMFVLGCLIALGKRSRS